MALLRNKQKQRKITTREEETTDEEEGRSTTTPTIPTPATLMRVPVQEQERAPELEQEQGQELHKPSMYLAKCRAGSFFTNEILARRVLAVLYVACCSLPSCVIIRTTSAACAVHHNHRQRSIVASNGASDVVRSASSRQAAADAVPGWHRITIKFSAAAHQPHKLQSIFCKCISSEST